jgi:ATP-binding cassette subfamily F protein 3
MENAGVQEFDGTYTEYNYELLATKIDLEEAATADQAEIERQTKILEKTRNKATVIDNAALGRSVHARQTMVNRLETRKIKAPFVDIKQPEICFELEGEVEDENILELIEYSVAFDEQLLEHVNFEMKPTDHVAVVGSNGTGKTTMLFEILDYKKDEIRISKDAKINVFLQNIESLYDNSKSLLATFEELGLDTKEEAEAYLKKYGFEEDTLGQKLNQLSGGEKDLFQLAVLSLKKSNFLLLDEPTGHLDVYAQVALEQAISEYKGAILMVTHDFYMVVNCMDYVLLVENNTIRRMSIRKFRQMIYENYFDKDYLLLEQKKKEAEMRVQQLLRINEFAKAKILMEPLKDIIKKM